MPGALEIVTRPSCMSTIDRTMARPSPEPPSPLLGPARAAIEAVEDVLELVGVDAHAVVPDDEASASRRSLRRATCTWPPDGRELDGVADEVAEHLAEAGRVVRLDDGFGAASRGQLTPLRAAIGSACSTALLGDGAQVVVAELAGPRGPNRAWRARAGWPPASRGGRPAGGSARRNSSRVAGSSAAPSRSSSLNVRSAAIGVRSSWLTSARNSRLRSRSSLMIVTDAWSRSAMSLNAEVSSATSGVPRCGHLDTRASRSALGEQSRRVVRRVSGRVSHCASSSAVMSATTSATSAALRRTSVIVRVVCSRDAVRIAQRHGDARRAPAGLPSTE